MESLKTGTVEIRQHVETTPTVCKNFVVGTVLTEEWQLHDLRRTKGQSGSFIVVGQHKVFKFIGHDYVTASGLADYTVSSGAIVIDEPELLSYLRDRAQKMLGDIIQEIEEGVFDD